MKDVGFEIDRYLSCLVRSGQIPGYAFGLTAPGVEDFAAFGGLAKTTSATAPNPNTQFAVYSVTKSVTALAALRIIARGVLGWDTPVADILEGWVDPLSGHDYGPVRVSHLLTHSAGFSYGSRSSRISSAYRSAGFLRNAPQGLVGAALYRQFSSLPRLYPPGAGWSCSLASDVLGWVISAARGDVPLGRVMREEVFDALGMDHSCFLSEIDPDGDVASVYERDTEHRWRLSELAMSGWGQPQYHQLRSVEPRWAAGRA